MTTILRQRIDHPSAWKASDFASPDDYAIDIAPRHIRAFDEALAAIRRQGLALGAVEREHFPVPAIADELAALRDEIVGGRGFFMVRGFPIDRYDPKDLEILYWGIGTHFGIGRSQSVLGDRVGHIVDMTKTDPHARAYRNKMELTLHTDLCDVIAMLSLQKSARGGMSLLASAPAIHNELLARHPEHLEALYRGGAYHRMNEEGPGESPFTPHDVPAFSVRDGQLSCRYIRELMEAGCDLAGHPLDPQATAAFDALDAIAARPDMCLRFVMQPGELTVYNNWTVLHGRTAFEDGERPDQKRHLLRLWLDVPGGRSVVPETALYSGPGIGFQRGKTPTVDLAKYERRIALADEERR
jgi:TfdA family taurine catabolism dioxygenase TauD